MKRPLRVSVVLVIAVTLGGWLFRSIQSNLSEQREKQTREEQERQARLKKRQDFNKRVAEMVRQHQAVEDWNNQLPKRDVKTLLRNEGPPLYTIELQRLLVRDDHR